MTSVRIVKPQICPVVDSWYDLDLQANLIPRIYCCGFDHPYWVQEHCIQPMMIGLNTMTIAPSSSGKTLAFIIGSLQRIDYEQLVCPSLILAPSRLKVHAIHRLTLSLGATDDVRCHSCIGGTTDPALDIHYVREGQHVVVGTPERVFSLLDQHHISWEALKTIVLYEPDVMISSGWGEQIYDILFRTPPEVQVCIFSAGFLF